MWATAGAAAEAEGADVMASVAAVLAAGVVVPGVCDADAGEPAAGTVAAAPVLAVWA